MLKQKCLSHQLTTEKFTSKKIITKIFSKFLLLTSLTVVEIAYNTDTSYAGTATLDASYNVQFDCTFNNPTYSNTTPTLLISNGFVGGLYWNGTLGISCNHGGKVIVFTSAPAVSSAVTSLRNYPSYYGEYLYMNDSSNGAYIWKNGSIFSSVPSVTLSPASNINYVIYMGITPSSGQILPNGNYTYSFTLTAIPN